MGLKSFLKARLPRAVAIAAVLLFGCAAHVPPAQAQFLGYTSPQTTTSAPFGGTPSNPTSVACTGTAQVSAQNAIQNIGQSAHYVYLTSTDITSGTFVMQGSNDGITYNTISDTGSIGGFIAHTPNSFLVGTGYYNFVRISVTCASGGHFSVQYSGTSVAPGLAVGAQQLTQYDRTIVGGVTALSNFTTSFFQPPFGSASGQLMITYRGTTPPTGSTLNVICQTLTLGQTTTAFLGTVGSGSNSFQAFTIPAIPCQSLEVNYTAGSGGSAPVSIYIDYLFTLPGMVTQTNSYAHITGTAAVDVKPGPGTLHTLAINKAAAAVVTLFDLPGASCTGTPTGTVVAIVTQGASDPAKTLTFDAWFTQGICVQSSAATDLTVNFN